MVMPCSDSVAPMSRVILSGDSPRAISTFLYHGDGLRGALIYYPQRAGTRLHKGRSPWHECDAHHANTLLDLEDLKTVLVIVKKKRQKFSPHLRFLPHYTCALRYAIAPPYLATGVRRVVGRERTKVVPQPRRERTPMRPCIASILFL